MDIGKAIKELRIKDAATQIEFAKSIGITQSYLSLIEKGHKKPSLEVIEKVADEVGVPLAILFWFTLSENDVKEDRVYQYQLLKSTIDGLIDEVFIN